MAMASTLEQIQDTLKATQLSDSQEGTVKNILVDSEKERLTQLDNKGVETYEKQPLDVKDEILYVDCLKVMCEKALNVEDKNLNEEGSKEMLLKVLNVEDKILNAEDPKEMHVIAFNIEVEDEVLNVEGLKKMHENSVSIEDKLFVEDRKEMDVTDLKYDGQKDTHDKALNVSPLKDVHINDFDAKLENKMDVSELSHKEDKILKILDLYEYPFKWQPLNTADKVSREIAVAHIVKKDEEIALDDESQWWSKFIFKLVLSYEYYKGNDLDKCASAVEEIEKLLLYYDTKEDAEPFYNSVKDAVFHVFLATKAFLQFFNNTMDESILSKIKLVEDLDKSSKAAMYGIQAAVFMEFGICGTKRSVELIKKAIDLDPMQGEWHFLLGKGLSRIRHVEYRNGIPEQEELKSLEAAVNLTKNPSYIIFLAQAYREASYMSYLKSSKCSSNDLFATLDKMTEQSFHYYKMALEERGSCTLINARCAKGFFKLRHPYKNVDLARQCIDKALSLSPENAMVNHIAGNIYLSQGEVEKAKEFLELASKNGAFGASMDLLRIKYKENLDYDPIPDLEEMLTRHNDSSQHLEVISQIASYHLFIGDDLRKSAESFMKIIDLDPKADVLMEHRCMFTTMKSVNIYEVLLDEARLLIQKTEDAELKEFCLKIIAECLKIIPEMENEEPKPRRLMALETGVKPKKIDRGYSKFSDKNDRDNKSGSGSHRGRGRGRGNSRGYGCGFSRESYNSWKQRSGGNMSDVEGQQRYNYKNGNQGNRFNGSENRRYKNEGRSDADKNWRSGPRTSESEQEDKRNGTGTGYNRTDSNSTSERVRTESNGSNDGRSDYEKWRRKKEDTSVDSEFVKPSDRFQMWRESKQ